MPEPLPSSLLRSIKTRRGFTLIELLVVIAIVALLISLLLPGLQQAREQAIVVHCLSNQRQLMMGLVQYAGDQSDRVPTAGYWTTRANHLAGPHRIDEGGAIYFGLPLRLGYLGGSELIDPGLKLTPRFERRQQSQDYLRHGEFWASANFQGDYVLGYEVRIGDEFPTRLSTFAYKGRNGSPSNGLMAACAYSSEWVSRGRTPTLHDNRIMNMSYVDGSARSQRDWSDYAPIFNEEPLDGGGFWSYWRTHGR